MNDQIPLLTVEVEPRLTAKQALVLAKLRAAGSDGLHTDEAGAWAHSVMESRWRHSEQDRCQWCGKRGKEILGRLRDLGLARYRGRMRVWQAADLDSNGRVESSQDTGWDKLLEAGF